MHPPPARLLAARRDPLAGREPELRGIADTLARAVTENRGLYLVTLEGDPGIGKTRIAAEAAGAAAETGARVLYGRSDDLLELPYQPWVEALADAPLEGDPAVFGPGIGAGPEERYKLWESVRGLLARLGCDAPLFLVLDDLHWANAATLELLRYVLSPADGPGGVVLATLRPNELAEPGAFADAQRDVEREERLLRLTLGGLEVADVERLIATRAGWTAEAERAELARSLERESAGNPFFIRELLRNLEESDAGPDAVRRLAAAPPESVRDVIRRRVQRLPGGAVPLLELAAVAGAEWTAGLLALASGRPESEVAELLDAAERAGLVVVADGAGAGVVFGFAHALVRGTLEDDIGKARRGRVHRQLAEALERLGAEARVPDIARHWYAADPPDLEQAEAWAERAGEDALARRDGEGAARWYARALELHERAGASDDERRCALLIELGRAQLAAGDNAFRDTLLSAARLARARDDGPQLVRAVLANNRGFVSASGEIDEERVAVLEAALAEVGDGDSLERAELLALLSNELSFSPPDRPRRVAMSDEALAIARRVREPATLCRVLIGRITIWAPENLEERLVTGEESVGLADVLGDPLLQASALRWYVGSLVEAGRLAQAERAIARLTELASRFGDPTTRWLNLQDRASMAMIHGGLAEAEALTNEALALGTESGQPDALAFYASQIVAIRWEQGRLAELGPLVAQAVSANPGIPGFRAALALAYADGGLRDEAAEVLRGDVDDGFRAFPRDVT